MKNELTNLIIEWLDGSRSHKRGLELLRISGHPLYRQLEPLKYSEVIPLPRSRELVRALVEYLAQHGIQYRLPDQETGPQSAMLAQLQKERQQVAGILFSNEHELKQIETASIPHPSFYERKQRIRDNLEKLNRRLADLDQRIQEEQKKNEDAAGIEFEYHEFHEDTDTTGAPPPPDAGRSEAANTTGTGSGEWSGVQYIK